MKVQPQDEFAGAYNEFDDLTVVNLWSYDASSAVHGRRPGTAKH